LTSSEGEPLRVLCILPTPPPYAGPEVGSKYLLDSSLRRHCRLTHIRSNVKDHNRDKGRVDFTSIVKLVSQCFAQVRLTIRERPQVTLTLVSQNKSGFLRDSCFVALAKAMDSAVVLHFRGGGFDVFEEHCGRMWRWFIKLILNRANLVLVQGELVRPTFATFVGAERVAVLPNGIDVESFRRSMTSASSRTDDSERTLRVLYVGHLSVAKGYFDLVEAIPLVLRELPDTEFVVMGEILDKERNILRDQHDVDLGLPKRSEGAAPTGDAHVRYLGPVSGEEKFKAFASADMLVLPSYSEGFPLSILEAMAAGLPIVATGVGVIPEIIEDGVNGFLVKPGEPEGLASAIVKLGQQEDLRNRMGAANLSIARERYEVELVGQRLYEYLATTARKRRCS